MQKMRSGYLFLSTVRNLTQTTMTHTFALRSSDNALVMIEAPDPSGIDTAQSVSHYQSALDKAIRGGVKVADQYTIVHMICDDLNRGSSRTEWASPSTLKHDTPYDLDVEMEIRETFVKNENYDSQENQNRDNAIIGYRQKLAYLVPILLEDQLRVDKAKYGVTCIQLQDDGKLKRLDPTKIVYSNFTTPAEPKEDIEFFKTSTPRPKMTNEDTRKRIANIIRENITFSGQIGDYIIHGAIEKLCDLIDENNRAWRDFHEQAEPKEEHWISVKDRLPEDESLVLMWMGGKDYEVGFHTRPFKTVVDTSELEYDDDEEYDSDSDKGESYLKEGWYVELEQAQANYDVMFFGRNPTHWMPLPEPPTIHRK